MKNDKSRTKIAGPGRPGQPGQNIMAAGRPQLPNFSKTEPESRAVFEKGRAGPAPARPGPRAGPGGPSFFGGGPGRAEGRDFGRSRGPERAEILCGRSKVKKFDI